MVLTLAITVVQIAIPLFTKEAIDRFLTLPWGVVALSEAPTGTEAIRLQEGGYLVKLAAVDPGTRRKWEAAGHLTAIRYAFVAETSTLMR